MVIVPCCQVAGTLLTAELALQHGVACNTAGGNRTPPKPTTIQIIISPDLTMKLDKNKKNVKDSHPKYYPILVRHFAKEASRVPTIFLPSCLLQHLGF